MGRTLGIVWMVYALLSAVGLGVSMVVGLGGEGAGRLVSAMPSILTSLTFGLATGLTYWLVSKASRSAAPIVIGWIHLIFAALGTATHVVANQAFNSAMSVISEPDYATMSMLWGVVSLAQLAGGVLFIIALVIAISTERKRPAETF